MKALILKLRTLDGISRERLIAGLISANISIWTHVILNIPFYTQF